jgi:hypothetical protein
VSVLERAMPPPPTEPVLSNPGFADLVLVILAGVVIIGCTFAYFRRR